MRITKHGAEESENIRRIKETLFSASLTLSQDGIKALHEHNPKARLSKMYVTCSTPWSYTTARNVYYEEDENFRVTDEIIDDLVKGAESEMLSEARDNATQRMIDEAKKLNADAIVNVRYATSNIMQGAAEILVYGTAVKLKK